MKKTTYTGIALLLAASALLPSCQADMDDPGLEVPEATIEANISILELKQKFENQTVHFNADGTVTDYSGKNVADGHYVIKGRVVSSDASGNIYKSLVIQDETAALAFSINQGSLYNEYRLGQEMVVDLTGLYLGYYRGLQQVGSPGEPYNGQPQLGFMPVEYWQANAQRDGLPDPDFVNETFHDVKVEGETVENPYPFGKGYCITFSDFDALNDGTLPQLQSQLVEFLNVHFQINEGEETFAPYQESVNRTLVDDNSKTLTVRNSGYSNFYNQKIPEGRGRVRGILSYYNDSWQIVLRDISDVMVTTKGQEDDPFTVTDIIEGKYAGMSGWTEGYIVGSVKPGVTTVTGASDVIFGAAAEMDNNVLIAASASETDVTRCAVVALPQGSMLRMYANLIDNPDVLGKKLTVEGTLGRDLGLPALTDCKGGKGQFMIDGKVITGEGEAPAPAGSGTEADPYNVSFVMQSTSDLTGVWVEGYVAGYVAQGDFADGAHFGADQVEGSTNYLNQTNIILSAVAPEKCGTSNSVPAQLAAASRPVLGLKDNPGVYGKRVKVKCRITSWLGSRALRNITEAKVLD